MRWTRNWGSPSSRDGDIHQKSLEGKSSRKNQDFSRSGFQIHFVNTTVSTRISTTKNKKTFHKNSRLKWVDSRLKPVDECIQGSSLNSTNI